MSEEIQGGWTDPDLAKRFIREVRGAIPLASEQIDIMIRLIGATGCDVKRFLDLGCGDGVLSDAVLRVFPESKGVLLDISETMLAEAGSRLESHADRVRFVEGDFTNPDWSDGIHDDGPFDAIISGFAIHHQTDMRKRGVYQELFNMLAPGAIFLNVEHVASATDWVEKVFEDYFIASLVVWHSRVGNPRSVREVAEEYFHRPDKALNILAPVEDQCRWLREIGYQDVDCFLKGLELAVFGGRRPKE